jgi:hypothetical protein
MSESQDRGGFEAPRAGLGGVTGPAAAALSAVAGAREKPAVIASYRGATPDAAVVAALAVAAGESVDATAIAARPVGIGPALAAHLPAGADPEAVRDWFELETIVELPAPGAGLRRSRGRRRRLSARGAGRQHQAGISRRCRRLHRMVRLHPCNNVASAGRC